MPTLSRAALASLPAKYLPAAGADLTTETGCAAARLRMAADLCRCEAPAVLLRCRRACPGEPRHSLPLQPGGGPVMRADPLLLDALAEVLGVVVARHGSVVDSGATWLRSDEVVADHLGNQFTVSASLHPGEARDAARDLADQMAAQGLCIHRQPAKAGNGLGARLTRLSMELVMASANPARVRAIAEQLAALAAEAGERDAALVPAHLRLDTGAMPEGVVRLADRRRA